MSRINVDKITGATGTASGAPITLSGDTATLGTGATFSGTFSGDPDKKTCKAWINFNGTGTVAIRDSFNVASLTDNGTGDYTITFSQAFSNINYCYAGCAGNDDHFISSRNYGSFPPTTTTSRMASVQYNGGGKSDDNLISVIYFGS